MNETKSLGQIAYEAHESEYNDSVEPMRYCWDNTGPKARIAWQAAASAVADEVRKDSAVEIEKLRRHRTAAMIANAELLKERDEARAECERLRKELDEAVRQRDDLLAESVQLRGEVACLTRQLEVHGHMAAMKLGQELAPRTDGKEPGQRAYEARYSGCTGNIWGCADPSAKRAWAHVERTIEAPLLDEIAAVKKRCAQIDNDLRDKTILYIEALRERDKARAEVERLREEIANMLLVDDEPSVPPEHELPAAVSKWEPTMRLRLHKACNGDYLLLQQLWTCRGAEEWRDVEEK